MISGNKKFVILLSAVLCFIILYGGCGEDDHLELNRVTFRVITPPDSGNVYITGNQADLGNWDPGKVRLAKETDTSWVNKFYFNTGERLEFKFTKGSWQREALDPAGNIPQNYSHVVTSDTVLTISVTDWAETKIDGRVYLSWSLINSTKGSLTFKDDFRFQAGDNDKWRLADFNDSKWAVTETFFNEENIPPAWNGVGWFRLNLSVDSTLWGKPAGIIINHFGASEVFLNGDHIFSTGKIGKDSAGFQPQQRRKWETLIWGNTPQQTIAVRYINYNWNNHLKKGFSPGFELRLKEINRTIASTYDDVRTITNYQVLFTIIPLTLAVLHLFIFVFYPYDRQNLFYSLCLFSFAALSFSINQRFISTDVESIIFYYSLVPISITFALLFGLYTTYAGSYRRLPKQQYIFLAIAITISSIGILKPYEDLFIIIYPFMGVCIFEMVRVIIKSREKSQSSVFIIVGFFFLALSVIYQILIDLSILPPPAGYSMVYGYGVLSLIFSMSMALSYNFARINKNLKEQLANVEVLSNINLERERTAKKIEIERTLLEADNKRKTEELDEARKLQLSFLPKIIPDVTGYEIAVYMKTATEVGGDYYDFHTSDEVLTVVIGDATGHGARAGTMVSAVKSLFNVLADEPEPITMIKKYTNALKSMNLYNLYMNFSIARFGNNSMVYSNAGMPPLFVFRCLENKIEKIIQKSMPLGSFIDFPYKQERIELGIGDTILFLSDGFTESFSLEGELLGLQKAEEIFLASAQKEVNEIVDHIKSEIDKWQGGEPPKDDITFIIIKKTS